MFTRPVTTLATLLSFALVACGGGGNPPAATAGAASAIPDGTSGAGADTLTITNVAVSIPASTYPVDSAQYGGWVLLQQARVLCGFGALAQNSALDAAAQAHANYLTHISVTGTDSVLSHFETITTDPYYTGYYPYNRTSFQGYGVHIAEILASTSWTYDIANPPAFDTLAQRGANSMRNLLNTVYHLMGAMYDGPDVGFGAALQTAVSGSSRREEYRFASLNGFRQPSQRIRLGTGNIATYPCADSTNVPPAFAPALESPNPFPSMTGYNQTMGPPIYLKVDAPQVLQVTYGSISRGAESVSVTLMTSANDPNGYLGSNEAFVIPSSPLAPNTSYSVYLGGSISGTPFSRNFVMTTGS